jgi:hypothetical protein
MSYDKNLDFEKYKPRLLDYLAAKGVNTQISPTFCFNPSHNNTGTPALILHDEKFACQNPSCGIHGDIYDAAGVFIGSDNPRDQYEEVVSILGGSIPSDFSHIKKNDFTPVEADISHVAKFMREHKGKLAGVTAYLEKRGYPDDIKKEMGRRFGWWPGFAEAERKLGKNTLKQAGIPLVHPKTGKSSWEHPGVVLRLGSGFKLFYYDDRDKSQKIGSKSCRTFPTPGRLPDGGTLMLAEGELNAISAQSCGLPLFSCGGTNGLTPPIITEQIIPKNYDEIIILFDGDTAGEKGREKLIENLINCGYTGVIKYVDLPTGNDPDDIIRKRGADELRRLIDEAILYTPPNSESPEGGEWEGPEPDDYPQAVGYEPELPEPNIQREPAQLSIKRVKSLLKKIPNGDLIPKERELFIAGILRYAESTAEVGQEITQWNGGDNIPQSAVDRSQMVTTAMFLEFLIEKVSTYLYKQTKKDLIPAEEKLRTIEIARCDMIIDVDSLKDEACVHEFLATKGNRSAADVLAFALSGNVVYVEGENKHYAFNGHHWHREPDLGSIIYSVLNNVLHAAQPVAKDPEDVWECMIKIQGRKFRQDVLKDFNGTEGIFFESINWDGAKIAETLTLKDGVMDFSGDRIVYRKSKADEFRREFLPYTVAQIKEAGDPKFFLKFMHGNFKDEDTLTTLMFYTSLIASRYTGYKYGGIFVGPPNTGKTTTIEVISRVYPGMIDKIPSELLMPDNRRMTKSGNEASPYIARLEGRGAAIAQESKKGAHLNGAFWKELTGGDTMTARALYGNPKDFQPTAQIILTTNYAPHFDAHDAAVIARMVIVPFKVQHDKNANGSMSQREIMDKTTAEAPGIVKLLASYYIILKHEHNGEIPLSPECRAYKEQYIKGEETDLSSFIEEYCIIDLSDEPDNFTEVQELYDKFCEYVEFDDKEKPTRNKFVRWMKRDFMEIKYEQKRMKYFGGAPTKIFRNIKLKGAQPKLESDEPFE